MVVRICKNDTRVEGMCEQKLKKNPPRAMDFMGGQSPYERSIQKRQDVLTWVYRWGYASAEIIRQVAGQTAGGYAKKLERHGLLIATKTESGIPRAIFTLTKSGYQEAERFADKLAPYPELDPSRVNQQLIRHNLLAQHITVRELKNGNIHDYLTERFVGLDGDKPGQKRPDVVWIAWDGRRTAVEVELTAKWERRLDEFVLAVGKGLDPKKGPLYAEFVIVTDAPAIERRYRAAMAPGSTLTVWEKNERGHWAPKDHYHTPSFISQGVRFILHENGQFRQVHPHNSDFLSNIPLDPSL